jgi:ATP-binding cassette subfamily B protein
LINIGRVLLLMLGLYLLSALFSYAMGYIMSSVSQETVYNMANDVKEKLDAFPLNILISALTARS